MQTFHVEVFDIDEIVPLYSFAFGDPGANFDPVKATKKWWFLKGGNCL
jgi:hypothetical protein